MIEILNVEKVFKNKKSQVHALKNVSLRVEKGDIFGIVGYSGAGKSTLYSTLIQENHDFGVRVNSDEIVISNGGDWRNKSDQAKAMKMAVKLIKDCMNKGINAAYR